MCYWKKYTFNFPRLVAQKNHHQLKKKFGEDILDDADVEEQEKEGAFFSYRRFKIQTYKNILLFRRQVFVWIRESGIACYFT